MLVTLTLPTSTAWSPEKSMPQYCWNCFEPSSVALAVYSVLLDPGQVMLEVSGVAEAEEEDDVEVGVEVGLAVTNTVVAAGLFAVLVMQPKGGGSCSAETWAETHDSVALARSACVLCRFLWLTPSPALSPMTAAMRMRSAAIRAKHELRLVPDDAPDGGCEYTVDWGAWP